MRNRDLYVLAKFHRKLDDFLFNDGNIEYYSEEDREIILNIYHELSDILYEDTNNYDVYRYAMTSYNPDWYEDDEEYAEFDRMLRIFYDKAIRKKEHLIPKPVKYLSYEYDYDTRAVKLKFSNGNIVTMNAIEFFTIESKISAMKYDEVIKEYAIEVTDNAS